MIWDYRLIRITIHKRDIFRIHRVFYDGVAHERAVLIETLPVSLVGLSAASIVTDLEMILDAMSKPVIFIPEWSDG